MNARAETRRPLKRVQTSKLVIVFPAPFTGRLISARRFIVGLRGDDRGDAITGQSPFDVISTRKFSKLDLLPPAGGASRGVATVTRAASFSKGPRAIQRLGFSDPDATMVGSATIGAASLGR